VFYLSHLIIGAAVNLTEKRKTREQVLDGVLLKAYRDTVELPDGGESVREWIAHPGASAVVPLFEDGSTLLVRQFRYPPQREFLEVPAGKLDYEGEDPEDVARRELQEEVGYTAATLTRVGATYPCIGYSDEIIHLFLAEALTAQRAAAEADEFLVPVRLPLAEAVRMARVGEILDAKSTVALLLVQAHLDHRGG
jgi:ADP-ribose pyrophosphatase